ncbi:MAG TPA: FGGY family carbohydrate kinase, partial [Candidatus Limnocylindria bacterium]|nr:FGGY family carbohydrate kinase [Candidatus Limnocylindria bacterium]
MLVLALETSTSSVKAMLYDGALGVVAAETEAYAPDVAQDGTQDAEAVYLALLRAGRRVAEGRAVEAVALGSTWHSVCVCGGDMRPVTPVYTWEYAAAAPKSREMRGDAALAEALYRSTGCMPNVTYPRQTLLYLRDQGLRLQGRHAVTQGGYCFLRMTGEFAETVNLQSGGGFIRLTDKTYDPLVLELLGMDARQFGQLVTLEDTAPLGEEAANAMGIPPGIPVVPAHSDGACSQAGSGCGGPREMTLSVGTSGAIRMV